MKKSTLYTAVFSSLLSVGAIAAPSFDANFEINTDVIDKEIGDTTYLQTGRVELNTHGKHTSGDNFVEGKGTIELKVNGTSGIADAYLKIGNSDIDVQLGRFEATNLFPKGKDVVVENAGGVTVYEANKARGRTSDNGGQIALHLNASDAVTFELATIYGAGDADNATGDNTTSIAGIRPVVTFKAGAATITAGYESLDYELTNGSNVSQSGFALAANFDVSGANVNLAVTQMEDDNTDEEVSSMTANMTYNNFGLGIITSNVDDGANDPSVTTLYTAYTMPVFDIDNASMTLAASYSTADDVATGVNDKVLATRLRFNYTF
ncbi:carbohydrate porin [Marinomonas aquiplantarum]|uniref:Raffinose porin n=1 Tax=Marinomonas aquiplantarum TaxID=491951 RepID=A0A366CWZ6_9GAMM|nr:carbohydrate porin [Marinomonas aquiplantarum]RBO82347.1 raffinose porin [Marinomonas aquiplantarum]